MRFRPGGWWWSQEGECLEEFVTVGQGSELKPGPVSYRGFFGAMDDGSGFWFRNGQTLLMRRFSHGT